MTSDLSSFAARLREFISICDGEPSFACDKMEPALRAHCDAEFNGMALVLFALQFNHNPAYRRLCDARKTVPDTITHWTQIPPVPAAAFKELELSCLPRDRRTTVFYSSGTTEHRPSRHFHNAGSLAVYETSLLSWFRVHVERGGHLCILTPTTAEAPHSSLVHMFDAVRRDAGEPESVFVGRAANDGSWILDTEAAMESLQSACEAGTPSIISGAAFSFVHLLDHLAEKKMRYHLPPGSLVMETGGYKGRSRALSKAELHALISDRLGVPERQIVCEYGMSELSSQAYDRRVRSAECGARNEQRVFRFPPWARVQIISPETGREVAEGETGLLRIFDLANVFSVMTIQTEDLVIRRASGFELIGRAETAEPRGCSLMAHSALL